jgi:hypothetical protein
MCHKKDEVLYCSECGLEVTVSKPCGCGDDCVILCCDKPMKKKGEDKPYRSYCCGG